jgi:hypothetical protein
MYMKLGNRERAIEIYRKVLEISPRMVTLLDDDIRSAIKSSAK